MADTEVKRGRGRPTKGAVVNKVNKEVKKRPASDQNGDVQAKRGRGRPRLPDSAKKTKVKTGKRGRPSKKVRKQSVSEEDKKNNKSESENDQDENESS